MNAQPIIKLNTELALKLGLIQVYCPECGALAWDDSSYYLTANFYCKHGDLDNYDNQWRDTLDDWIEIGGTHGATEDPLRTS